MNISSYNPKIFLSNSLTTGLRFVKKINLSGVKLMNYAVYTPMMLVKEKIIKYQANLRLISDDESAYLLLSLIKENDYGLKQYVTSFGGATKLLEVINDYRFSENDKFTNLIDAKYGDLLKDYQKRLNDDNLVDYISALNLLFNQKQIEECFYLDDLTFRPLEQKVFSSMFKNFEQYPIPNKQYNVSAIYKSYGQYHEVLTLLNYIDANHLPIGDVEVLYTDSTYENLIKGLCSGRNIPYTLKNNHAKSSNFVSFIYDILDYIKNDYKYELLKDILANQGLPSLYLKEFQTTLYFPKYVVGVSKERSIEFVKAYQNDRNVENFLPLFSRIISLTDSGLDYEALIKLATDYIEAKKEIEALSNQLMSLKPLIDLEKDDDKKIDLILSLLDGLTYSEGDNDEKLSFSRINRSFTLRKYIFVLGCNQTFLLGSDIENAFIKDVKAYQEELNNDANIRIAANQRTALLDNLKYYLSHSEEAIIILSYSYYDKVNLKDMTEGIRLIGDFSINHKEEHLYYEEKHVVQFENKLKPKNEDVSPNFDNGVVNKVEAVKEGEIQEISTLPIQKKEEVKKLYKLAPTDVHNLIECPFKFYYQKIFGIPSLSFPKLDETTWLEANTKGTMFHKIMEEYFNRFLNKQVKTLDNKVFEAAYDIALKEAVDTNPINNQAIYEKEASEIKEMAKEYLTRIIDNQTFDKYLPLACEFQLAPLKCIYKEKVGDEEIDRFLFTGTVDRVDGYIEGDTLHLRIVDYKTSKDMPTKNKNKYYQHILYSYVILRALDKNAFNLKYNNVVVDQFVYTYPFVGDKKYELIYDNSEIIIDTPDYIKVFEHINGVLLPYLKDEINLLDILNALFNKTHQKFIEKSKFNNDLCGYCTYQKHCIKKLEWGDKTWPK